MNISFIGYGNMAKAIARGLIRQKKYTLSAAAPSLTQGMNQEQILTYHNNKEAVQGADVIILAVKPKMMGPVLEEIKPYLAPHTMLISVAAGISLSWFTQQGLKNQAIIRTMPNTPAAIGLGATPMIANSYATDKQKSVAESIFKSIGLTTWVQDEDDMDTFTALSGSGPAYVFLFIEALINAGVSLGLDETIAKEFTFQTMQGALKLAQESDLSLNQLRTKVTSPGGTTAAALSILEGQLEELVFKAMKAAKLRSHELGTG